MVDITLKRDMVEGVRWVGFARFFLYLSQFVVTVVLARLLPPKAFGALSAALIFSNFTTVFNEIGMMTAVIQRKGLNSAHVSTAFWICVIIGCIFFGLGVIAAPFIADFFKDTIVRSLVILFAIKVFVDSLAIIQEAMLRRRMAFRDCMIIDMTGNVFFGLIAIGLAFNNGGILSMGWGYLVASVVRTVLLWCFAPLEDWRVFDRKSFLELFEFGKNILGYKMLNFFVGNIDVAMIGRFLGAGALGVYSMALNLANLPRLKLSAIISQVAFPALAKIQEDKSSVRYIYLKIVRLVSVMNFPLLAGLAIAASFVVPVVFGERWVVMVWLLRILCVYGMVFSVTTLVGNVYDAMGRPDYSLKFCIFNLVATALAVGAGFSGGLICIAILLSVYAFMSNLVGHIFVRRLIHVGFPEYFKALLPAIAASGFMSLGLYVYLHIFRAYFLKSHVFGLVLIVFVGTALYAGFLFVFSRATFLEMTSVIESLLKKGHNYERVSEKNIP